jgi:hypothetical protein
MVTGMVLPIINPANRVQSHVAERSSQIPGFGTTYHALS